MYERVSNVYYPPGSVIKITGTKDQLGDICWFLNNRPLIVLSVQTQMFDSLLCIPCGSRERPGIEISLWDYQHNCWLSGHQYSTCFPYNAHTVRVNFIKECIGHLDPWTFKAVQEAFLYHIGLSDKVPPYMEEIHQEMYEPRYVLGTEKNTQLGSKHYMISRKEASDKGIYLDPPISDPGRRHVHSAPRIQIVQDPPEETDFDAAFYEEAPPASKLKVEVDGPATPLPLDKPPKPKPEPPKQEPKSPTAKNRRQSSTNFTKLGSSLPEDVQLRVLTSLVSERDIKAYGLPASTSGSMSVLRNSILENHYVTDAGADEAIRLITLRLSNKESNWKFLTDIQKYIAIAYASPKELKLNPKFFDQQTVDFCRTHGITYEWACTRRQIPNRTHIRDLLKSAQQKDRQKKAKKHS